MVTMNLDVPEASASFTSLLLQLGIVGHNKDLAIAQGGGEEENGCGFA